MLESRLADNEDKGTIPYVILLYMYKHRTNNRAWVNFTNM